MVERNGHNRIDAAIRRLEAIQREKEAHLARIRAPKIWGIERLLGLGILRRILSDEEVRIFKDKTLTMSLALVPRVKTLVSLNPWKSLGAVSVGFFILGFCWSNSHTLKPRKVCP